MQTLNTVTKPALRTNPPLELEADLLSDSYMEELIHQIESNKNYPIGKSKSNQTLSNNVPRQDSLGYAFVKRSLDIVLSIAMLVLTSPILLVTAILVKRSSKGPVFFVQTRLGRDRKEFKCYKFRSMVTDAEELLRRNAKLKEEFEQNFKLAKDPRITPIGEFIRKTSIDELPQFLNVLKGEMTLVGPRPKLLQEVERYGIFRDVVWSVKPGLAGLWQVLGRSDLSYQERIATEVMYVNLRSTSVDIVLLWHTFLKVIGRKGAV